MARIPIYQDQYDKQPEDNMGPAISANAPAAAFGSDGQSLQKAGQGLQTAGATLAAITEKMQQEKDQADATNAVVNLHKQLDQPISDMRNRKNGDAVGLVQDWDQQFPQIRDQAGQGLSPGAQKLYNKQAAAVYVDNRRMFANQEAEERRNYLVTTNNAAANSYGQTALTNYTDTMSFEMNVGQGLSAMAEALKAKGIAPDSDAGKQAMEAYQSKLLAERADRYITNHDFASARKVLNDNKGGRILGEDAEKVEGKLKEVDLLDKANTLAASWKGLSPDAAFAASRKLADPILAQKAMGIYHAQWSASQQARQLYVQDAIVRGINTVDNFAKNQDWTGLQNYLDSLPKGTVDQMRVQQQVSSYGRANIDAATGITGRFTKPSDYMGLLNDIGPGGKITSPQQLMADPRAVNVDMKDRNHLIEQLKGNTTVNEHELMTQYKLAAGYANSDDPQAKLTTDDQADFMRFREWAQATIRDSKQGKDPNYLKSLATQWKLSGETKDWWAPGYGRDRTFGDMLKLGPNDRKSWLPDLPEAGTLDRQKLDAKFAQPGVVSRLKRAYKTDSDEQAKRMYYRDLIYDKIPMQPSGSFGKGRF